MQEYGNMNGQKKVSQVLVVVALTLVDWSHRRNYCAKFLIVKGAGLNRGAFN